MKREQGIWLGVIFLLFSGSLNILGRGNHFQKLSAISAVIGALIMIYFSLRK